MYDWTVDLSTFKDSIGYSGFFTSIITSNNVAEFERKFYKSISEGIHYEVAGEVCYWKNYGTALSRNKITKKLLEHLEQEENWKRFADAIVRIVNNPTYENFIMLRNSCNQVKGFATPITFLSFYNPLLYPMVDKHIADWWQKCRIIYGYNEYAIVSQRKQDGWIQTYSDNDSRQNWKAYLAWKEFCIDYAERVNEKLKLNWRTSQKLANRK